MSSPQTPDGGFSANPMPQPARKTAIPDEAYAYALDGLLKGHKAADVRQRLREAGYSEDQVSEIVNYALDYRSAQQARARSTGVAPSGGGPNNSMLVGGIICLVGIVVTIASMAAASSGGTYVVAWGAIVFGGIQFFRGLAQNGSGSE